MPAPSGPQAFSEWIGLRHRPNAQHPDDFRRLTELTNRYILLDTSTIQ